MYTEQELAANKKIKEDRKVRSNLEDQAIKTLDRMNAVDNQIMFQVNSLEVLKQLMKEGAELGVVYQNLNQIYHNRFGKTLQDAQREALGQTSKMIVT